MRKLLIVLCVAGSIMSGNLYASSNSVVVFGSFLSGLKNVAKGAGKGAVKAAPHAARAAGRSLNKNNQKREEGSEWIGIVLGFVVFGILFGYILYSVRKYSKYDWIMIGGTYLGTIGGCFLFSYIGYKVDSAGIGAAIGIIAGLWGSNVWIKQLLKEKPSKIDIKFRGKLTITVTAILGAMLGSGTTADLPYNGAFSGCNIGMLLGIIIVKCMVYNDSNIGFFKTDNNGTEANIVLQETQIQATSPEGQLNSLSGIPESIEGNNLPYYSEMPSEEKYNLVYAGAIADGHNPDAVKARVAELFGISLDKAEKLFTGERVILKKDIDLETAQNYYLQIEAKGAICQIEYA